MKRRSRFAPLAALLLLAPMCKPSDEVTCADPSKGCGEDPWAAFETRLSAALDPGARVISPLQDLSRVGSLRATVVERSDGASVVVLWGPAGAAPARKQGATTSAVALVGADGVVTPIATDRPALDLDRAPRAAAYGSGAVLLSCASSPGNVTIVDAVAGAVTASDQLPFACDFSNQLSAPMLGRGLDPSRFTAASAQELGVYSYEGTRLQRLQTFPTTGSVNAWVEEIATGVVASLSWSNSASDPSGRWTYHRSDTGAGPSVAPTELMLDPRDASGLERVRREPGGSLLVSTGPVANAGCAACVGLFRWHVESDGRVERLAELPPPPFGAWEPTGFGRAISTELGPNPEHQGLTTTARFASLHVAGDSYELAAIRRSPCADDGRCRRFGETYTLASVGSGPGRLAVQALWTWAGPTVVAAAPAAGGGGVELPDGGAPDGDGPADATIDAPVDAGEPSDAGAGDGAADADAPASTWNAQLVVSGFPGARFVTAIDALALFTTDGASDGQVVGVALPDGPVTVTFAGRPSPAHVTLTSSKAPVSWMWTETGGGTIESSAQGTPLAKHTGQDQPFGIVDDGSNTYWTNLGGGGTVMAAGSTGTPFKIASNEGAPTTLVADTNNLYWLGANGTQVRRRPKSGGAPATLVTDVGGITALATHGGTVYFGTADGRLLRCPADSCPSPSPLASGFGEIASLAADAAGAYFTERGKAPGGATVQRVPAGSSAASEIARGTTTPHGIAITSSLVLWVTSAGELWRAPRL